MPSNEIQKPWYRQLWPWMLIAIPFSSVMGGVLMIYLAVSHPNDLVKDNYYQDGMAINRQIDKDLAASRLGVQADIGFDEEFGDIVVDLRGVDENALIMELFHPIDRDKDKIAGLAKTPEEPHRYRGQFQAPLFGRWYVELRDADDQWRMRGRITFPVDGVLEMRPVSQ
jgi:hypothetical protein